MFRYCSKITWHVRRNGHIAKASGNEEVVRESYNIIDMMCPDFVNIHNRFNFDLRLMAASAATNLTIRPIFEERRLGNVSVGIL